MNLNKSVIVISSPRSGSNFLGHILRLYLSRKNETNVQFLHIFYIHQYNIHQYKHVESVDTEIKRTLEMIRKSEESGNFNIYHTHFHYINNDIRAYFKEFFSENIILVTRKNIWEQFLSYYISSKIGLWHFDNKYKSISDVLPNKKEELNSIDVPHIKGIVCRLTKDVNLNEWKNNMHIYYEDWIPNPLSNLPNILPQLSDIREYINENDIRSLTKKMDYPCSKEDLFENIDEIKKTFIEHYKYLSERYFQ